jgi:protein-tyrosine phosphatase
MTSHQIDLPGIGNARELGGFTVGGRTVKQGVLLRTASLESLSDEAKRVLQEVYKVATIVDFRMTNERRSSPDPEIPGVENLFAPVLELTDFPGYDPKYEKILADPTTDRLEIMRMAVEMGAMNEHLYVNFLFGERGKAAYRTLFQSLLSLPKGRSILWHCKDGKDRTGVASMLILLALGADKQTILEDYLLTNEFNRKKLEIARIGLQGASLAPRLLEFMLFSAGAVSENYMVNALNAMEDRCGSWENYLSGELGIGREECEVLRLKFLDEQ